MNTDSSKTVRRKPLDAASLAAILPGLGHIYCGEVRAGMAWMAASVGLIIGIIICLFVSSGALSLTLAFILFVADVAIWIVNIVLTWKLARSRDDGSYRLRDYNHWMVYIVLIFVSLMGTAFGLAFMVRERAIQVFVVPNASMMPTIESGDRLIAQKEVFLDRDPNRGELVIFRRPDNRRGFFLGRVIAIAGDEVEWRENGEILVNGAILPQMKMGSEGKVVEKNGSTEYFISLAPHPDPQQKIEPGKVIVPPRHGFVLGDNRFLSYDSRSYGPIAYTSLVAKPVTRIWGSQIGGVK